MSAYLPDEIDVRRRVDNGRLRAKGYPYLFTDDAHLSADGVEVYEKVIERTERTGRVFCCYLCGHEIVGPKHWHLDHITLLILRGFHTVDNLEAACDVCNLAKSDVPLEVFLGRRLYAEFLAGGGVPPFQAMRHRPTAELWARSHEVARRFARRPREVPAVQWDEWYDPDSDEHGLDGAIARVLMDRPRSEWHKAMSLDDLRVGLGFAVVNNLNDNYWLRSMGLNDRAGKPKYHDNRLYPSPLVVPVQFGERARTKGYKLRLGPLHFRIMPDSIGQFDGRRFRDQDEFLEL